MSSFGSTLAQFGLIWWLTVTTGSGTTLALAALAGRIPLALPTPLTGALSPPVMALGAEAAQGG